MVQRRSAVVEVLGQTGGRVDRNKAYDWVQGLIKLALSR